LTSSNWFSITVLRDLVYLITHHWQRPLVASLSFSPTLDNVKTLDTTIVLLFCLGLCSVCLALGGMSGIVLLLAFDGTVGSLLATRTALECGSILGLLCTAVTAHFAGLLFVSHFEAWTDTRVSGSVGFLAGLGTIQSEYTISKSVIRQSYT
jgi:hypothetical protein